MPALGASNLIAFIPPFTLNVDWAHDPVAEHAMLGTPTLYVPKAHAEGQFCWVVHGSLQIPVNEAAPPPMPGMTHPPAIWPLLIPNTVTREANTDFIVNLGGLLLTNGGLRKDDP